MGRLFWIILMSLNVIIYILYKREAEGDLTDRRGIITTDPRCNWYNHKSKNAGCHLKLKEAREETPPARAFGGRLALLTL